MARCDREQSDAETETAADVSLLYRVLANKYRRIVIRSLDETHTPVPRDAFTTYVAKNVFPERTKSDFIEFRDRVLYKLHHVHLPLLAEADVIEIEDGQISPGTMFSEALILLDDIPGSH